MNAEQILKLVDAVSKSSLTELSYEGDGMKLSMKKAKHAVSQPSSQSPENMGKAEIGLRSEIIETGNPAGASEVIMAQTGAAVSNGTVSAAASVQAGTVSQEKAPVSGNVVKSPLVGTFYAAPAEDADPFVKAGDRIEKGQVLAIVEAMKLMNEIESDFSGTVTEVLVTNGEAVEYGQPLFVIS